MKSLALLEDLQALPMSDSSLEMDDVESTVREIRGLDRDTASIELSEGVEKSLFAIFDARNVPDKLSEAHRLYASNYGGSLHEHYQEKLAEGAREATGFISGLKGKLAELQLLEKLNEERPTHEWRLPPSPNQPGYDLIGTPIGEGQIDFVQSKMGGEAYVPAVEDAMDEHPNFIFWVSREIFDKLEETRPDLTDQLRTTGITNLSFTNDIKANLAILGQQWGLDFPDSLGEIIPYVNEIVLGIRFLIDVVRTERDLASVDIEHRTKVHAMKAMLLFSRFGVTSVCSVVGGTAMQLSVPLLGVGAAAGSLTGAGVAIYLNRRLRPRIVDIAMRLTNIEEDGLFYLQNKPAIDGIGLSLASTKVQ